MRGPHNLFRLIRVGATFEANGAMPEILDAAEAPRILRSVARAVAWPLRFLGYRGDPSLPPVPRALTAMGPAYIKLGQVLSTRPDVIGADMAVQLRVLQDKLPPFPTEQAREAVETELGRPLAELFSSFSDPVAAASIAQVHKAHLVHTGAPVAVKVLRPGIEKAFRRDIDAFYAGARLVEILAPKTRRLRPTDTVAHFESVVMNELDLRLESASASEFAANTENDAGFEVPAVVWSGSGKRVMTLEWVDGLNPSDVEALDAIGHDRSDLARRVLQMFLRHALRDGFFHSDMHQGNLRIGADGAIIALDFGIMGRIDPYTRRVYAEILYGFIQRNYQRVAEVHFEAGYVPSDQDVDAFALALRAVGEPIFGMDASQISMGRLLTYLFEVTERFGMETRTELILLQRTMVVVEGVARTLDPQMNIWEAARPVVEDYVRESIGPKAALRDLAATAQVLARFGPRLPALLENALIAQSAVNEPQSSALRRWRAVALFALAALIAVVGFWAL